jgi:hypothetical protein
LSREKWPIFRRSSSVPDYAQWASDADPASALIKAFQTGSDGFTAHNPGRCFEPTGVGEKKKRMTATMVIVSNRNTRRDAGPLAGYLDILSTELRAQRYASNTIRQYLAAAQAFWLAEAKCLAGSKPPFPG